MNTAQARNILANFDSELKRQGPITVEKMAVTGISLVVERLQSRGVEGASYSENRLPNFYFADKELNQAGTAYVKKADDGVTWGEFRIAQGLQASRVDLTYSGRMLGGWVPTESFTRGGRFTARTGGSDSEIDAKLAYQVQRYGDKVFDTNESEQREVDEIAEDDMLEMLKRIFR